LSLQSKVEEPPVAAAGSGPRETLDSRLQTPDYCRAAIPDPYRILGLRLHPFSLGHYLLLQRFGCACLADAPIARVDLILGVLICSMRHAEFLAFLEQKNFLREVKRWGKRIGFFELAPKEALFRAYLRASLAEPDYIALHPGESSGDWAQNLKMTLVTRLGYTEPEALDMPLSKALADYYALAESEGMIRLLTPEDLAMAAANDAALSSLAVPSVLSPEEAPCPA